MLLLIGIPVVDACAGDARGVVACIRDQLNHKFGLTGPPDAVPVEMQLEAGNAPAEVRGEPQTAPADALAEPGGAPAEVLMELGELVTLPAAALPAALDTKPVDSEIPVADELGAGEPSPDAAAGLAAQTPPPGAIADPQIPPATPAELSLQLSDAVAPQVVGDVPEVPAVKPDSAVEPPPAAVVDSATPAAPAQRIVLASEPDPITPSAPDTEPPAIIAQPEVAASDAAPAPLVEDQPQQLAASSSDVATLRQAPDLERPQLADEPPVDVVDIAPAPAVLSSDVPKAHPPLTPTATNLDLLAATSPVPDLPEDLPDSDPLPAVADMQMVSPAPPSAIAEVPVAPQAVDPANALADWPTMPPALQIAQPVDPIELSEISPAPPPATPDVAKIPVLAPTIDAIEIEGDSNFVAGDGPEGATVRLYVDDQLVGESEVVGGRWLVEGVDLLGQASHMLRIEAIDSATGKLLGSAVVSFEIELPKDPAVEPDAPPVAEPKAVTAPAVVPPPPPVIDTQPESTPVLQPTTEIDATTAPLTQQPDPVAEPVVAVDQSAAPTEMADQPTAAPHIDDVPAVGDVPDDLPEISDLSDIVAESPPVEAPAPLPPITPITPTETSASVTILTPPAPDAPTLLPPMAEIDHEPAVQVLPLASIANLDLPVRRHIPVIRAYPIGELDAHRFASGKAIIRRGDTLWSIAHRYYGHGIHFWTIVHANRDRIRRPSRIYPGQVFDLPLVTDD